MALGREHRRRGQRNCIPSPQEHLSPSVRSLLRPLLSPGRGCGHAGDDGRMSCRPCQRLPRRHSPPVLGSLLWQEVRHPEPNLMPCGFAYPRCPAAITTTATCSSPCRSRSCPRSSAWRTSTPSKMSSTTPSPVLGSTTPAPSPFGRTRFSRLLRHDDRRRRPSRHRARAADQHPSPVPFRTPRVHQPRGEPRRGRPCRTRRGSCTPKAI